MTPSCPRAAAFVPASQLEVLVADRVAEAVVERAGRDHPHTLLVMASHGRGRVGELVIGSVAAEVLRRSA